MKFIICFFLAIFLLVACNSDKQKESKLEVVQTEEKLFENENNAVRTPIDTTPTDTINVARMEFENSVYDFGEIKEGKKVEYTYKFTNNGKVPLLISDAKSTCGCTVPKWSKEPIAVGETGEIKVVFDSKGKIGRQDKPVNITANTWPILTQVKLVGQVLAPMLEPEDETAEQ